SEKYAIDLPSGDQAGSRSAAPGVCVRLRAWPLLAGTVKISPRASKTARAPVGDRAAFWIESLTLTKRGRAPGRSARMVTSTLVDLPLSLSYRNSPVALS